MSFSHSGNLRSIDVVKQLRQDGFVVIENVLGEPELTRLRTEIERLEESESEPILPDSFSGYRTTRYFDLLNEGEVWQDMATHPLILEIVGEILGKDCLLSLMCTVAIEPGEIAQETHCDDDIYHLPRPHPELVLNTIWAVNDFTKENGATRVVEGSHELPEAPRHGTSYDSVPVEMPAGSCALILGSTYHGGGANHSGHRRDGVIVNYCAGIMRQQDNLMLGISKETVRSFSLTLRRLIGYRRTWGGAGHVAHMDPNKLLQ